jgi:hypothetical protein
MNAAAARLCLASFVVLAGIAAGCGDKSPTSPTAPSTDTPSTPTTAPPTVKASILVDHTTISLDRIPADWLERAKAQLHVAYGHTSHGSQLVTGMSGLMAFRGPAYTFRNGGGTGALDLRDTPFSGASDLGAPDRSAWATATRTYLRAHPEINVVLWSWCGQVSTSSPGDIDTYLSLMAGLENEFPGVRFVYMTGHLDGSGLAGTLHQRNEQIRAWCRQSGRVLFDFADIETYDPDGRYYGDRIPNDACDYDANGDGKRERNWAADWQASHAKGVDWFDCPAAHSQPLNANMKAYAAWWLFARLAGWGG